MTRPVYSPWTDSYQMMVEMSWEGRGGRINSASMTHQSSEQFARTLMKHGRASWCSVRDSTLSTIDLMSDLIRSGVVCGTCADEGITSCNCYDLLEDNDAR
jgi:hypothetical protein